MAFWIIFVGGPLTLIAGAVGFGIGVRAGVVTLAALAVAWTASGVGLYLVTRPSRLERAVAAAESEPSTASCRASGRAHLCTIESNYGKDDVCARLVHDGLQYLTLRTCGVNKPTH